MRRRLADGRCECWSSVLGLVGLVVRPHRLVSRCGGPAFMCTLVLGALMFRASVPSARVGRTFVFCIFVFRALTIRDHRLPGGSGYPGPQRNRPRMLGHL